MPEMPSKAEIEQQPDVRPSWSDFSADSQAMIRKAYAWVCALNAAGAEVWQAGRESVISDAK